MINTEEKRGRIPVRDPWPAGIQVFCLGSPHGDDQIGWLVGDALRREHPSAMSRIHFLNHAWQLAGNLDQCHRAVLIDACCDIDAQRAGLETMVPAGTIVRMEWPDSRLQALRGDSTHRGSVAEALELAATLDWLPKEVIVYGIVASQFRPGLEPSPDVLAAIPSVVRSVESEIAND